MGKDNRIIKIIEDLVEKGWVETCCVNESGEFTYQLTERGVEVKQDIIRKGIATDGEFADKMEIAMQDFLDALGGDHE